MLASELMNDLADRKEFMFHSDFQEPKNPEEEISIYDGFGSWFIFLDFTQQQEGEKTNVEKKAN